MNSMPQTERNGSALLCAMCTIGVLSIIAASVLMNCATRYNTTSRQVKGWKEALIAAEGGADLAFAEIRKYGSDSSTGFASSANWSSPAPSPIPSANSSWELGYAHAGPTFGDANSLSAKVTVDKFQLMTGSSTVGYYRIRSIGTAKVGGLRRTGMDDRMDKNTRGDSILRKIDFNFDHFLTTYGYGDALATATATTANGKTQSAAVSSTQVTRRIEMIAIPVMPITGAVTTTGAFHFPLVDSYDSQYGAYPGTSTPATAPYNTASLQGDVVDGSSTFSGTVYGNVTTNGGSASSNSVSGVIDNNVPGTPISNLAYTPGVYTTNPGSTITPPAMVMSSSVPYNYQQQTTFWYHYSSINGLTINAAPALYSTGLPTGGIIETNVNIVCDGDVSGITVGKGVNAKIYFSGDVGGKANSYDNNNVDGVQVLGTTSNPVVIPGYRTVGDATTTTSSKTVTSATASFTAADVGDQIVGTGIPSGATIASVTNATTAVLSVNATATSGGASVTATIVTGYTASTNVSECSHFWMIGEGVNQSINLGSGGPATEYVVWYAPNADFSVNGNPDFVGAVVAKSFSGNGNCTFHYDLEIANGGTPTDYRIASYVEDVR